MVASALLIIPVALLMGRLSDKYEAKYTITIGFFIRGLSMCIFIPLEDPNNPWTFAAMIFAVLSSVSENIAAHAYYYRNIEKSTRGIMCSLWVVASSLGVILYSKLGGHLYD